MDEYKKDIEYSIGNRHQALKCVVKCGTFGATSARNRLSQIVAKEVPMYGSIH